MKRLAHISDLHFGKTDEALVLALEEELDRFNPDLLVVTGDLTQRARVQQFEQARGFLDALPFARLVMPGNHDIAPLYRPLLRVFNPYRGYARFFPPALNTFFVDDQMLVIGLNTVHPLRWKEGMVSQQQIDWIEALVSRYEGKFHVLAAHHPLVQVEETMLEQHVLRSEPLLAMLGRVGIDLVLTGHLHESYSGRAARTFGVTESLLVAQASTATSTRLRGHVNAYNRITLDGGRVEIELRTYRQGSFSSESYGCYQRRNAAWGALGPADHVSVGAPM